MRKALLSICSFLLALSASAAVHYYHAVPRADGLAYIEKEVEFPCCITGRVVSAEKPTFVTFIPATGGRFPATVLTYTGTGTVYAAATRIGEGQAGPQLTPLKTVDLPLSANVETMVTVQGLNVKTDSAFAVRIGTFDPFRVSFDGNGGVVQTNSLPYTPGSLYGALPSATYEGHLLEGWATAPTNGIAVSTNTMVCLGYPTLYAQWRLAASPTNAPAPSVTNYVVTFSANGGYGNMATQTFAYGVAQALSTNLFARTNYTFTGWATSPAGAVRYRNCEVVSNLTAKADDVVPLYASWMISADQVKTGVVDGVTWHYTVDGGFATVQNISSTQHVAAVSTAYRGRLVIPESLGGAVVDTIGERAFEGCAGITEVEIPPSVTSIGNRAFAGCTGLGPGITIPETVESLGSAVFADCSALRIVRYYGDCPQVDSDLYAGAPRKLVSGVLRVRRNWADDEEVEVELPDGDEEDDEDLDFGGGATVTVQRLPSRWPEGGDSRGLYWLSGVRLCTVALNLNGGALEEEEPRYLYYVPERPLGDLPDAVRTEKETKLVFDGWFTEKVGGLRAESDWIVTTNLALYAHWKVEDQRETAGWEESMYDDAEVQLDRAAVYDGYLYEQSGTNDFQIVGTIVVKQSRGRYSREEEATTAAATATVQLMGVGKATFKGAVDETGEGVLVNARTEEELEVTLSRDGLSGSFDGYLISGARNRTKSSLLDDRQFVAAAVGRWGGTWNVALRSLDASGDGAAFAEDGVSALSVTVGTRGVAKVTGMLSDGTSLSFPAQMIFGDGCACVPVFAPLYARKSGGFALLLWFSTDEEAPLTVCGLTGWDARNSKTPFEASFEPIAAGRPNLRSGEAVVSLGGSFAFDDVEVDEDLLPAEVPLTVRNGTWSLPKADKVGFSREDGTYEVSTERGNAAALKLSCGAQTGVFKGGFTVFAVTESGRARKIKASVYGVVVGEAGYGTALVKKVGSAPVTVSVD